MKTIAHWITLSKIYAHLKTVLYKNVSIWDKNHLNCWIANGIQLLLNRSVQIQNSHIACLRSSENQWWKIERKHQLQPAFGSREQAKSECDWLVMSSVFVTSQSSCFFLCSREQIRVVENQLYTVRWFTSSQSAEMVMSHGALGNLYSSLDNGLGRAIELVSNHFLWHGSNLRDFKDTLPFIFPWWTFWFLLSQFFRRQLSRFLFL